MSGNPVPAGPSTTEVEPTATPTRISNWLRIRLSAMWFLEQFVVSCWIVTVGTYMVFKFAASGSQISLVFIGQSIGTILAAVLVGIIADRFLSARTVFIMLHVGAAIAMFLASTAPTLPVFIGIALVYMVLYMPTQPLANSIVFDQLTDPEKQFPLIRVFGTIGWIFGGLLIGWFAWEQNGQLELTFVMSGIGSLVLALFGIFLLPKAAPRAPRVKQSIAKTLGLDALALLKSRSYLVFFIASILICIPVAFYNNFTNLWLNEVGVQGAAGVQTLAQVSEVVFFLVMPFLLVRFGLKKMMLIGMFGWVLRFVLFSFGDVGTSYWMIILGLVIHGLCYDFFFVSGQIYTDRFAPKSLRSSAQGLIFTGTYGVGFLIGAIISGPIVDLFLTDGGHNWQYVWILPAAIAAVAAIFFLIAFKEKDRPELPAE